MSAPASTHMNGARAELAPRARHEDPTGGRTWPLWGMALLAVGSLAAVTWQTQAPAPIAVETDSRLVAPVLWQRALHFEDRPDGSVAVLDGGTRLEVSRLQGEQGFARGALRMLAHARLRHGLSPEQPFLLTGHANGRLTLSDPATRQRIDLESFGPTNAAVFARLRDVGRASSAPEKATP
jgi:putative photosynthetic complex assembly protein